MNIFANIRAYGLGTVLLAAALAVGACGGGGSTSNSTGDDGSGAGATAPATGTGEGGAGGGPTTTAGSGAGPAGNGGAAAGTSSGTGTGTSSSTGAGGSAACSGGDIGGTWALIGGPNGEVITETFDSKDCTYVGRVIAEVGGAYFEEEETGTYTVAGAGLQLIPEASTCSLGGPRFYTYDLTATGDLVVAGGGKATVWAPYSQPVPSPVQTGCNVNNTWFPGPLN